MGTSVLALAALGGAAFETARWQSGITDFDTHKANNGIDPDCQTAPPDRGGAACKAIYDRYTSAKQFAIIGYAVGGALAVTSLTLFLVDRVVVRRQRVGEGRVRLCAEPAGPRRGLPIQVLTSAPITAAAPPMARLPH